MKKIFLTVATVLLVANAWAQEQPNPPAPVPPVPVPAPMPVPPVPGQTPMPGQAPMPGMPASGNPTPAPAAVVDTKITFVETSHAFGKVIEGEIARYEFKFTNDGTKPLKLSSVNPSCGCTSPKWPREEIAPGATASIIVEYNSQGRPGSFTKYITVNSNGSEQPISLTISGEVVSEPAAPKSPVIIGN